MSLSERETLRRLEILLDLSEEEAKSLREYDKAIDRGNKDLGTLDKEREKASRKYRQTGERKTMNIESGPRPRKPNLDKQQIIKALAKPFPNAEIINPEREFTIVYQSTKYKVTLSVPRK